jgi:hypothetical protein
VIDKWQEVTICISTTCIYKPSGPVMHSVTVAVVGVVISIVV